MPSRRRFLGAAGLFAVAGCLSAPSTGGDPTATTGKSSTERESTTADETTEPAPTTERGTTPEPVRGDAAEATVERTVEDDDYQYVESNDTVRYPALMSGDTVVEYAYEPFEDWGRVEGASVAAEHVRSLLEKRVPDAETLTVAMSNRGEQDGLRLSVSLTTHLDRDGEVLSEPSVSRSEVVESTPRSATATVYFAGRTHTETYPVYVREATIQNE